MAERAGRRKRIVMDLQKVEQLRVIIDEHLSPSLVLPQHTDKGHFYKVDDNDPYPSVTGKIGIIKDESIRNFDMNEALRYVEEHMHEVVVDGKFNMVKALDLLHNAKKAPKGIFVDAADIGRNIHDGRERYFQDWIDTNKRPNITDYYKSEDDPRLISGLRAISKFCDEQEYFPIRCELMVYSDKFKTAGTLDDVGMINTTVRPGKYNCEHELWDDTKDISVTRCPKCDMKKKWEFCLMDLKSSNQFKDSYFFQVALYYMMFVENTGLKPERCFILKVSKENGTYKIEEMKKMRSLIAGAKAILKLHKSIELVKKLRKNNSKLIMKSV